MNTIIHPALVHPKISDKIVYGGLPGRSFPHIETKNYRRGKAVKTDEKKPTDRQEFYEPDRPDDGR